MSIYAYVGMPGSGKSYDVVANQILPALKQGRRVVTNIPLHMDVIRQLIPDAQVDELPIERIETQPELIEEYARPGVVLIIDECWRLWPSGLKAHQVPEVYKTLLAEHRHRVDEAGNAMLIVLVTQDLAQLSAFARQLVEQTFYHTKLTHLGSAGTFRVDVYRGPQTGANPPRSERLREILGRYDRSVFKLYKSHTMSEASGQAGANEKTMDPRGNVWRRPMLWVTALACVVFLAWGVPKAVQLLHNPSGRAAPAASGATSRPASPFVAAKAIPAPGAARAAFTYRVSAWLQLEDDTGDGAGGVAYLIRSDGASITIDLKSCALMRWHVVCEYDGGHWTSIAPRFIPSPGNGMASGMPKASEAPGVAPGA